MTFSQAIAYFTREASLNLIRGWKVSLLAILTIGVSLFLAGTFLVVSANLQHVVAQWQGESKVVVYLETASSESSRQRVQQRLTEAEWAVAVEAVSAEVAGRRFRETFPALADLLDGWGEEPLPASFEVSLDWDRIEGASLDAWLEELRAEPAVSMIDDDRDWLRQLQAVVLVLRGLGMVLGAILLATAIFMISSVIRLTAFLYRDEIAIMRLVGATEFLIRGPFYMEGLLQGLVGGGLAVTALLVAHSLFVQRSSGSLLASVLATESPGFLELLLLVGLGGLAGLIGAVTSLRKETLGQTPEAPDWSVG
ncbi:MAG: hypothetical protein GY856_41135 [bacterium]|nr:hypothetical protein [bacterium]